MPVFREYSRNKWDIKIYIVFHKNIYGILYNELKLYRNNVAFIGTKKNISNKRRSAINFEIIYEKNFDKYFPDLLTDDYRESTAICHAYINKLYSGLDYIGFAQYDMAIGDDVFNKIYQHLSDNSKKNYIFYSNKVPMLHKYGLLWGMGLSIAKFMINSYNKHFHSNYTLSTIIQNPAISNNFILWSTFIIPVKIFKQIMAWVIKFIYESRYLRNELTPPVIMGHIIERAHALALALELLNNNTVLAEVPILNANLSALRTINADRTGLVRLIEKVKTLREFRDIKKNLLRLHER